MGKLISRDRRPEREMNFRLYEHYDRDAVVKIFKSQGLDVHLPLPLESDGARGDPATAITLVGEEDGVVKMALILRATLECHFVVGPEEDVSAAKLRRISHLAEGAAMQMGVELKKLKFPVFTDVIAFVPRTMQNMVKCLKDHLGFIDEANEPDARGGAAEFQLLWKVLGK